MTGPAYPTARAVAATIEELFERRLAAARQQGQEDLAPGPDAQVIEKIIDTAFWASLRREEGHPPRISLAFLPPERAEHPLTLEHPLPFAPSALVRLAPAVERPGIHLGVWCDRDRLYLWGAARAIPSLCFVLEVVEPGLLVVKHGRAREFGKFTNVAVIQGEQVKLVDEAGGSLADCPALVASLAGFDAPTSWSTAVNVLVQLAVSMRAHGRGGSLLVVPQGTRSWRESIVHPIRYSVAPPFTRLAELMRQESGERAGPPWQQALHRLIEGIAGLTAVDGATVISDRYELLAFGVKIARREGSLPVQQLVVTEPVLGRAAELLSPVEIGGTRHLSAAQFIHDQRDALALVASQDGRYTVFAWSPCAAKVHAHRVDVLLL